MAGQQRQGLPEGQPAHEADPGAGLPVRAGLPARRLHVPGRGERGLRAAAGQDTQGEGQDHVRSVRLLRSCHRRGNMKMKVILHIFLLKE